MVKDSKTENHENRDRKRDRDGVQAQRRAARRAKEERRVFEEGGKYR